MGVKAETSLQKRIQNSIIKRGGYVNKNWGNMTSKPGIGDLTCGYKGFYIEIEVKEDNNTPSLAQGIHCRKVWHAGNIAMIAWSVEEVTKLLEILDSCIKRKFSIEESREFTRSAMKTYLIDDGTRW